MSFFIARGAGEYGCMCFFDIVCHSFFIWWARSCCWYDFLIPGCRALILWHPHLITQKIVEEIYHISIKLLLILCVNLSYPYFWCTHVAKYFTGFFHIPLSNFLRCPEFNGRRWRVKGLSLNFDRQFSMLLFLRFFNVTKKWKVDTKNKMDNPRFVDEETIPLVQD